MQVVWNEQLVTLLEPAGSALFDSPMLREQLARAQLDPSCENVVVQVQTSDGQIFHVLLVDLEIGQSVEYRAAAVRRISRSSDRASAATTGTRLALCPSLASAEPVPLLSRAANDGV